MQVLRIAHLLFTLFTTQFNSRNAQQSTCCALSCETPAAFLHRMPKLRAGDNSHVVLSFGAAVLRTASRVLVAVSIARFGD
jgi:hypothetical protein